MEALLDNIYELVWGAPLLVALVALGTYLTIRLRGIQFRYLWFGIKATFTPSNDEDAGDISHFQALTTALAATIGIGNVAGVATAITVGGLGALFWMWLITLIGMSTKYAESLLALRYRVTDRNGEMAGGPMYYIEQALGWRWLAIAFALFGAIATFGGGNMIQANSVADALYDRFAFDPMLTAVLLTLVTAITLLGGIKSIGTATAWLVPFMALFYLCGGVYILIHAYDRIPGAFLTIVQAAFSGQAATGAFVGSTVGLALQSGISRGLMCSESGMGTGSIAAAAAKSDTPGRQAMVSMAGSFMGTFVMCTVTAFVLAVTDAIELPLNGAPMTLAAFNSVIPGSGIIVTIGIVLFAFTTILGNAYYGERCIGYLFGVWAIRLYRTLFILAIIPGALLDLHIVWRIADICNGLMTIPNVIALFALGGIVSRETALFESYLANEEAALRHEAQVIPQKAVQDL